MDCFLGLDLGTSGLRALLVDAGGAPVGSAEATYPVHTPHPGWSEQDPADWIAACRSACAKLAAAHPAEMGAVAGIGLSGQMHGAVLVDAGDNWLRPAILWNDTRAGVEAARLDAMPGIRAASGNIVFPGFTAPKLAWLAAREPEVFAATDCVLLPKDALRLWLTGARVTDMSDAAGTSWLDVAARDWSDDLLAAGGMRRDQMPALVEGSQVSGHLRTAVARALGLRAGIPVAGGGADNAAAACGAGVLGDGQGFLSLGTSGVILAGRDAFAPAPETAVHSFCHAVPGRWYQMGVILAATDCLNWLARTTGTPAGDLARAVEAPLAPPGREMFLPYLSGERTPHNDTRIRAALTGVGTDTDTGALTRAVFAGVAFALGDALEALGAAGARPERLLALGGGSRSELWLRMIATVLGIPLQVPEGGAFGAAAGAARLAICAATGAGPEAVMARPGIAATIEPEAALAGAYREARARWRALYPALRDAT